MSLASRLLEGVALALAFSFAGPFAEPFVQRGATGFGGAVAPAFAPVSAQTQAPPAPLPMDPVDFPAFAERTLGSGARLLVVTQDEVPFVTLNLVLRGGSAVDPEDRIGTASFATELLTKGTPTRTADDISGAIDFLGGSLGASASSDWITVSLSVLEPDLAEGLELLADVVMNPTFPEDELELVRTRALSGLQASLATPAVLASRAFTRAVYGAHPYGRLETAGTLAAIDRASLEAFHDTWFRPDAAIFVVAGSVTVDEAAAALDRAFRGWTPGSVPEIAYGGAPSPDGTRVVLVHRPGAVQAVVRAGHLMVPGDHPDWTAFAVANQVLGGGASGRLFKVLREEKGWTYGAFSSASRRRDLGVWQATLEARNEVAGEAIAELMRQVERLRTEMVPAAELNDTQGFLVGSFPLQIETPQQIAGQVVSNRLLGLPDDALETYRERVAELDASDLRRAATEHLHPDRMVLVVVGDATVLHDRVAPFGPVTVVDAEGRPLSMADLVPAPSEERFDASILEPGVYEYQVAIDGTPVGEMTRELAPDSSAGRPAMAFRGTIRLGAQSIDQEVVFGVPDFDAVSARMTMAMGDRTISMRAAMRDGRLVGTVDTPDGPQPVDREIPAGTLIADMVELSVWLADLEEGREFRVPVARLETGTVENQVMRVGGIEEITVPAGTFRTYRVELEGSEPQTVWARVEAPHVLIRLQPAAQPIALELTALPPR